MTPKIENAKFIIAKLLIPALLGNAKAPTRGSIMSNLEEEGVSRSDSQAAIGLMSEAGLIVVEETVEYMDNPNLSAKLPSDILSVPKRFGFPKTIVYPTAELSNWLKEQQAPPKDSPESSKRGRPKDTNEKEDEWINDAWRKLSFPKKYVDLDNELGLDPGTTKLAVDRMRQRLKQRNKSTE